QTFAIVNQAYFFQNYLIIGRGSLINIYKVEQSKISKLTEIDVGFFINRFQGNGDNLWVIGSDESKFITIENDNFQIRESDFKDFESGVISGDVLVGDYQWFGAHEALLRKDLKNNTIETLNFGDLRRPFS